VLFVFGKVSGKIRTVEEQTSYMLPSFFAVVHTHTHTHTPKALHFDTGTVTLYMPPSFFAVV
jgi:hypothetical protein